MRISRFAIPVCVALLLSSCDEPTDPEDNRVILEPVAAQLTGVVGSPTESPPQVRAIRASDGSPVAGVMVEFRLPLLLRIGVITRSLDTTDASGIASAGSWVLGQVAGLQTLHAFAFQYTASTTMSALARAGAATSFSLASPFAQYELFGRQPSAPSIVVRDLYGNGIQGLDAVFSLGPGGGSLGVLAAKTNSNGYASAVTWTIPATPGAYTAAVTIDTRTFDFTAHRVDSTSLAWYSLDSLAQSGKTSLPAAWNLKGARLGLTPFDPCFCVNLNGVAFDIYDYQNGSQYETSGPFKISAGKATLYDAEEVKGSSTGLIVLRIDYYSINPISYFYSRRN